MAEQAVSEVAGALTKDQLVLNAGEEAYLSG
jgi:hypothetical protein